MSKTDNLIEARDVYKSYRMGQTTVKVLEGVGLTVHKGEFLAVVGASGSGKSTLLHLLGGLDEPTAGTIAIDGQPIAGLTARALGSLRNRALGFVYQFHHLLPEFSALENVAMPLLVRGVQPAEASQQAAGMLERVGLSARLTHKPGELSGGERQRAAVARALVTHPRCVIADEPTGNLDQHNAAQVYALMLELNQALDTSLLVATHDPSIAARMDRIVYLDDGHLRENHQ